MARTRKKKKSAFSSLVRAEAIGILIVCIAGIAWFRGGWMGEWLAFFSRVAVGNGERIVPIVVLLVALDRWIVRTNLFAQWTVRHTGAVLLAGGALMHAHYAMVHARSSTMTFEDVMAWTWSQQVAHIASSGWNFAVDAGGGWIGALLLGALILCTGVYGALTIIWACYGIGLLLLTGVSYGDVLRKSGVLLWGRLRDFANKGLYAYGEARRRRLVVVTGETSSSRDVEAIALASMGDAEEERPYVSNPSVQAPMSVPQLTLSAGATYVPIATEHGVEDHAFEITSEEGNHAHAPYQLPSPQLLARVSQGTPHVTHASVVREQAQKLEVTLQSFGVKVRVLHVVQGPAVTRYELQPDTGVKVSRIVSLTDDIALALAAKDIRMEAPIPGKSAIGIEVPNAEVAIVSLREVVESPVFQQSENKLTIVLGRDITGQPMIGNLAKMPHVLVAGATGSGKSVCINGIITSILFKATPDEVKFLMIDPKMVELNVYNGIPHLLAPVVTDPKRAALALKKVVVEMEKRYALFSQSNTRNIEGYNMQLRDKGEPLLPLIVVIVDELADLMMVAAGDVEEAICRLAQMARAAGIHLILATQRPSVDVITGVIKANIPSRIAFGVSSQVDSRTILDMVGAEKLLGRGDMLYLPVGASKAQRIQGAFLSDQEVETVVHHCRNQGQVHYASDMLPDDLVVSEQPSSPLDESYNQAVRIILESKQASASMLQRRMRIGYARAGRLIDQMEAQGIVGPYEGSKPRSVLWTIEQFDAQEAQQTRQPE